MGDDTAETVVQVADALEGSLQRIRGFATKHLISRAEKAIGGPVVDVPSKITGLAPHVLRQFGLGPGDALFDHATNAQEALDRPPLEGLPGFEDIAGREPREVVVPGPVDVPPPADTAVTGVIDP